MPTVYYWTVAHATAYIEVPPQVVARLMESGYNRETTATEEAP